MAAPPEKTMRDLTGKWTLNKSLSSKNEEFVAMQGIPWVLRKAIGAMTITFTLTSSTTPEGVPSLSILGFQGNEDTLIMDNKVRKTDAKIIGEIEACASWCDVHELKDEWLRRGWTEEESEGIKFESLSEKRKWNSTTIWGFQEIEGQRRLARRMTVTDGTKTVEALAVYDWNV